MYYEYCIKKNYSHMPQDQIFTCFPSSTLYFTKWGLPSILIPSGLQNIFAASGLEKWLEKPFSFNRPPKSELLKVSGNTNDALSSEFSWRVENECATLGRNWSSCEKSSTSSSFATSVLMSLKNCSYYRFYQRVLAKFLYYYHYPTVKCSPFMDSAKSKSDITKPWSKFILPMKTTQKYIFSFTNDFWK